MNIGIIDADLLDEKRNKGKRKHRFPNLASMKISSYYKSQGYNVNLILSYDDITNYDKVFISKVFTDTIVPDGVIDLSWVEYGGTGFFYDKAEPLAYEIEHCMPDYNLYSKWVESKLNEGISKDYTKEEKEKIIQKRRRDFAYYLDYSIGFLTRGCIRGCSFCVNKNYKQCLKHSPVSEFLDENRKYICFLDDNFFSCPDWKSIIEEVKATGKRFQFKQGLDERLLTDEKCEIIFNSKWIGYYIFAFDNVKDSKLIEEKLNLIRKYTNKKIKFYTFCGYNHDNIGVYDEEFWVKDIVDLFERIRILMNHGCLPYVMRHEDYKLSPYKGIYIAAAGWCNQPSLFGKLTFEEYCKIQGMSKGCFNKYGMDFESYLNDGEKKLSFWKYYDDFAERHPEIAEKYFHMRWNYQENDK